MSEQIDKNVLSQFKVIKKTGSGAYGHVFKVIDRLDNKVKALKKNFDAFNNSTDAQRTYRQIMFLLQVTHPNIVTLERIIRADNDKDIYLVFQYMDIDLYTLIRENILVEKHKKYIFYQVVKAIYFLHSAGLINRDIKPSNILVNQNCTTKICDFGLVRSVDDQTDNQDDILTDYIATRWYRAPQIILGSKYYSKAIDIWGIGCLLGELTRGKPIFPGTSTINQLERVLMWTGPPKKTDIQGLNVKMGRQVMQILSKIKKTNKSDFFPNASAECLDLIQKTLQFNPQNRINIGEILKHPYLKEFYNPQQILTCDHKIKIEVNDNRRLPLKDYRQLIYKHINDKSNGFKKLSITDSTLYRIRQPHKTIRTEPQQGKKANNVMVNSKVQVKNSRTVSIKKDETLKKKSHGKTDQLYSKKLKTAGNDWEYFEQKKISLLKEQLFNQKGLLRQKKSITEAENPRNIKLYPTIISLNSKKL